MRWQGLVQVPLQEGRCSEALVESTISVHQGGTTVGRPTWSLADMGSFLVSWALWRFACSSKTEVSLTIDEYKMKNASRANATASQSPAAKEFFELLVPKHNETLQRCTG